MGSFSWVWLVLVATGTQSNTVARPMQPQSALPPGHDISEGVAPAARRRGSLLCVGCVWFLCSRACRLEGSVHVCVCVCVQGLSRNRALDLRRSRARARPLVLEVPLADVRGVSHLGTAFLTLEAAGVGQVGLRRCCAQRASRARASSLSVAFGGGGGAKVHETMSAHMVARHPRDSSSVISSSREAAESQRHACALPCTLGRTSPPSGALGRMGNLILDGRTCTNELRRTSL